MTVDSWNLGGGLGCLCFLLAPLVIAAPANADPVFTDLGGGIIAKSINDKGVVVGVEQTREEGFVRAPDGTMTFFSAQDDAIDTAPSSINNSGVITGEFARSDGPWHGFVRDAAGAVTSFDPSNSAQTYALSINASGAVTGWYYDQSSIAHGFVRGSDGTITIIDVPNAAQTMALGINDNGEIVGTWYDSIPHGFVRSADGTITSFDVPAGAMGTYASAINAKGTVTGAYLDQANVGHGYIRKPGGRFISFDVGRPTAPSAINGRETVIGWGGFRERKSTKYFGFVRDRNGNGYGIYAPHIGDLYPYSINKHGVVVGTYYDGGGDFGFIWTP